MSKIINKDIRHPEDLTFSYLNDQTKKIYPLEKEKLLEVLREDEVLAGFRKGREKTAEDRYRPRYHYTAPYDLLNDPNGLCFWEGKWHLFYQHIVPVTDVNGNVNSWGTVYWSHIVSDDLVHWTDLPHAIYPNPEKECWSGAVCVDKDKVTALYFGYRGHSGLYSATASDPLLLNWTKCYPGPVIPEYSGDGTELPYIIYDPCIWKKDGIYYALSGTHVPHPGTGYWNRTFYLFRSENAVDWEYLHPFVPEDTYTEVHDDGACPYFLPLGDKYVLIYFSHARSCRYLIGEYDTDKDLFLPCGGGRFNQFRFSGVQAPSAFPSPDGDGSAYLICNTHAGFMSLPYHISLAPEKDMLMIAPCDALSSLRKEENRMHLENVKMSANQEIVLENVSGNGIELIAEFDLPDNGILEMKILRSSDNMEYTKISVYKNRGSWERGQSPYSVLSLDCSHSQLALHSDNMLLVPSAPDSEEFRLYPGEKIKLHVFIDRSAVDVFCNDRVFISKIVYPTKEDSIGVSVTALAVEGELLALDAWEMNSIDPSDLTAL